MSWSALLINANKTKDIFLENRGWQPICQPVTIEHQAVEIVGSSKHLDIILDLIIPESCGKYNVVQHHILVLKCRSKDTHTAHKNSQ